MCELVRCTLDTIGNFSYNFTAIIYVLTSNGSLYFKCKEEFIYKVRTELENNDIHFAYPIMKIREEK
jgi:small-conductance mechanosensitive channel